jgi:hypothetical protein
LGGCAASQGSDSRTEIDSGVDVGSDAGIDAGAVVAAAAGPECGLDPACKAGDSALCAVACESGETCDLRGKCAAARYTVSDAGIVTDAVTGLVWQQDTPANQCPPTDPCDAEAGCPPGCSWSDAQTYCENLQLGGYSSGWTLPTIEQLFTLFEQNGVPTTPTMNSTAFPTVEAVGNLWYWSATPVAGASAAAWYIAFSVGEVFYDSTTGVYSVRCVH